MRIVKISANLYYYIFWILLLIGKGVGMSSQEPLMIYITWIAIPFCILKLFFTKWTKQEFYVCFSLLILGLFIFIKTHIAAVLLTIISICAAKNIDLRKLLKCSFCVKAFLFFITTSLAIANLVDRQVLIRYDSGDIHTVRYALGYGQPNTTHYTLFIIFVLLFLSYKNIRNWMFIICQLYNCLIFTYTDSRTGFLLTSLLIVGVWAIKNKLLYKVFKLIGKYLCYIYIILATLSLASPLFLNFLLEKFNSVSLGTALARFQTGTSVILDNNITIFGIGNVRTDFGFIFIGYQYGVIILMLFVIANTYLLKLFYKRRMFIEFFILLIYAIYTTMEPYSASILMNVSLIFISLLLYSNNKSIYLTGEKRI